MMFLSSSEQTQINVLAKCSASEQTKNQAQNRSVLSIFLLFLYV